MIWLFRQQNAFAYFTQAFFLRKFTVKPPSWTETPCDNILLTMPDLIFPFCLPATQKNTPWKSQVRAPMPARMCACVSVWEALDIKVNFNKVRRLAGGMGETCQAQMLSLCVPSHPVFTSSGQLAAFSFYWTGWQSHIFTASSIWTLIIKKVWNPLLSQ